MSDYFPTHTIKVRVVIVKTNARSRRGDIRIECNVHGEWKATHHKYNNMQSAVDKAKNYALSWNHGKYTIGKYVGEVVVLPKVEE